MYYRKKQSKEGDQSNKANPSCIQGNRDFSFPEGGWVCSQCQNYNFSGRLKCNRCCKLKGKDDQNGKPMHLIKKTNSTNLIENEEAALEGEQGILPPIANLQEKSQSQGKKVLTERIGDWVCMNCKNLNFSFRKICNRC